MAQRTYLAFKVAGSKEPPDLTLEPPAEIDGRDGNVVVTLTFETAKTDKADAKVGDAIRIPAMFWYSLQIDRLRGEDGTLYGISTFLIPNSIQYLLGPPPT